LQESNKKTTNKKKKRIKNSKVLLQFIKKNEICEYFEPNCNKYENKRIATSKGCIPAQIASGIERCSENL